MTETRSISTKEAARMLRARLKHLYPTIRFSVRFESYSMGSHINVSWTDGPTERSIATIADAYSGSRFDGSSDSTYYVESWLRADGCVVSAGDKRIGDVEQLDVPASAELIRFSGSTPDCRRNISTAYEAVGAKAWDGLSDDEKAVLVRQAGFPNWEGFSDGYKLAVFFDANQLSGQ